MEIIEPYNMLVPLLAILLGSANSADPSTPRFTVTNVCYVDYGIELTNLTLDSLLACCSKCLLNDECQTVVYDEADKLCRLNAAKALTLQVSECDNTVRYAEFKTGEYAFECITDDDCTNKNPMLYCADNDTCLPAYCASPWIYFDKSCYWMETTRADWSYSFSFCENLGAEQVEISSSEENAFVASAAAEAGLSDVWLNLNDKAVEGTHVWLSGEAVVFTRWAAGEGGVAYEDCVMVVAAAATWHDVACSRSVYFVCEKHIA